MLPVLIGWIIGVPLTIWWPRPPSPDHPSLTRAYTTIRVVAALLLVSFGLYITVVLRELLGSIGWLPSLGIAFGGGAFMISPLATCASALDVQRRSLAIVGSYGSALLAAGQVWFSFSLWLELSINDPYAPWWCVAFTLLSTGFAAAALALTLELYAMVRRPPAS
jgi:hypothetical protein